jgi:hypothetical protein
MSPLPDRLSKGLLAAALFSGLALCVPALRGQPLALDEHVSYFAAGAPTVAELCRRSLDVMATPPLPHLLERTSLALFGHSETALRLPSLAAYLVAILIAFLVGRRMSGPLAGGLAAVVLAWHPEVLDEVRIARCYGLELALSAASIWAFVRWLQEPPSLRNTVLWTLSAIALLWTHYLAAPLVAAEAFVAVLSCLGIGVGKGARLIATLGMLMVTAIAAIPLAPALGRLSEWSPALNYRGTGISWRELDGVPWLGAIVAACALAACLQLAPGLRRPASAAAPFSGRSLLVALSLWLLPLAVLLGAALLDNPTLANLRYRIPLAPASALFLSIVLVRLVRPAVAVCLAAVALVGAWSFTPHGPFHAGRLGDHSDVAWKQVGLDIADELSRNDTLVFTQTGLTEGFLVPLYPDDERLQKYVACRLGKFYTKSENAWSLPLVWSQEEFKDVCRGRLRKPEIAQVIVVAAMDTDLNRASFGVFDRLAREEGFEPDSGEIEQDPVIVRYQRTP